MHRRLARTALVGAVFVGAMLAALTLAGAAAAVPLCTVGQIVKTADPTLSAPSPTYAGNTITSSGGSWTPCGASISGFYKEWLRDGAVFSGPTWVAGAPGPFTYVAQSGDVGHVLTSAVLPCNAEGCYGSYVPSTNAVVPASPPSVVPPPPPPPPATAPPPMQLYFDEGVDYSATDTYGNVLQQSLDNLPDGSYEISQYGGTAGAYSEGTAQPLLDTITTGGINLFSLAVAGRRCYGVDKHRTAHDAITGRVVWRFHHVVHWCATYPDIDPGSVAVDSFFSDVDPLFQVDWDNHGTGWFYTWRGSPTGGHYSRRQAKIDNCILKWGCIGSHYPQIEIWVNGNGAWAAK
jgi:hypothetical protein